MTDRPQYGEYASPEEQRRAAGVPLEPPSVLPETPRGGYVTPGSGPRMVPPGMPSAGIPPASAGRGRIVDRIATIALLAYGLINVFGTIGGLLNLPTMIVESLSSLGVDAVVTDPSGARGWGTFAALVYVVVFAVTVYLSIQRLRTGKLTWWIPLVGAVVAMILVAVILGGVMMSDPGIADALRTLAGAG